MRIYNLTVSRPAITQEQKEDPRRLRRSVMTVAEGFDDAATRAVTHYNDIDGVNDYYVTGASIVASTEEGEGAILLV